MRRLIFILLVTLTGVPAAAAGPEDLVPGGEAVVTEVVDGDTVALADGRQVRLVGIQAPKLPLGRPGFAPWPLGEEAKAHLAALLLNRAVELRLAPAPEDRHGRVLAHVVRREDGLWAQGEMLKAGLARVYTFADNRVLAGDMLALEGAARARKAGLWALARYAVRAADAVPLGQEDFYLVEGRVADAQRVKDRVYLNFGADWRSDFTVKVKARDEARFAERGVDVLALKGAQVRVRGWVKDENGPMIELDHPERLEVLAAPRP